MAQQQNAKIKGCKKCGRSGRKGKDVNLSLFVRGKIDGKAYFQATNQKVRQ